MYVYHSRKVKRDRQKLIVLYKKHEMGLRCLEQKLLQTHDLSNLHI